MTAPLHTVRSYTRSAPGKSVEYAKTTVQLYREVRRPIDNAVLDHMAIMLELCVEDDVRQFGEDE